MFYGHNGYTRFYDLKDGDARFHMIYFVIIYSYILMIIYIITLLAIFVILFGLTQYGMFSKKGQTSYKELIKKNCCEEEFHNSYKVMRILESEAAIQNCKNERVKSVSSTCS